MISRLVFLFSIIILLMTSCNRAHNCHTRMVASAPICDSLFLHGDSAEFHKSASKVIKAAECVLAENSSDAEQLDAKVVKETTERNLACWPCHVHVREMEEFHAAVNSNAEQMSRAQWAEVLEEWKEKEQALEADLNAVSCVGADKDRLLAMRTDFVAWGASTVVEGLVEEADALIEEAIDEGLHFIEGLLGN